jgi:hypothetical protein
MSMARPHVLNSRDVPAHTVCLILAAALLPVLIAAGFALYVRPEVGIDHFAWSMRPLITSMMLGATYLGGASFFVIVLLTRRWRHIRLGFLPISAFAATLGLATLIHWDAFAHERWSFWVWTFLYVAVPVILPILWFRNNRLADGEAPIREGELSPLVRRSFGVSGVVLTVAALLLFVTPQLMIATWPWTLTPLTARVMAALFILPGLVGLGIALDGSWASARHLLTVQALTIALMLGAIVVARADLEWSSPASWIFVGGMSGILLLVGYARLDVRTR